MSNPNSATGSLNFNFTFETLMENVADITNTLSVLVMAVSWVLGIWYTMKALYLFRQFGAANTQAATSKELKSPIVHLMVAGVLLYLPTAIGISLASLFDVFTSPFSNNALDFSQLTVHSALMGSAGNFAKLLTALVRIVQFIGLVSFVKGWLLLSHTGESQQRDGSFHKGIVHVIAGIACINFVQFTEILISALGVTFG